MRYHYSLEHATQVLNKIFAIVGREEDEVYVQAWANGREQGYYISYYCGCGDGGYGVCFAQQRNSDSIVVVWGPVDEFDLQTNQPSEHIWEERRKYFDEDDEAAVFIIDKLSIIEHAIGE